MTIRREDAPKDNLVRDKGHDTKENDKLTTNAGYVGGHERNDIANGGALLSPLDLKSSKIHRASGLSAFREQYEIYKLPVHHSQRALGRVNDLRDGGAPRTPAEIDPKTAGKFRELSTVDAADAGAQNSANQWIEQQAEMEADFNAYMTAREAVQGVTDQFRATMEILHRRRLQAEKAGKQGEKDKIDQMAKTCTQIVQTAIMAGNFMTALEGGFLASSAAGDDYTETVVRNPDTGKDEIGHKVTRTGAAQKAYSLAKQAAGQLTLENIFIALDGSSAKYQQLIKDIAELETKIAESDLKGENFQISGARKNLENVKISVKDKKGAFSDRRQLSRDAAQTFGQNMKGGKSTIAVALMAEAYQELDMFGGRALEEAHQLHKPAKQVITWLANHSEMVKAHRLNEYDDFADDAEKVLHAAVDTERTYPTLKTEVPIWQQTATSWKHFLSDVMGKKFDKGDEGPDSEPKRGKK
jgi:hypothetical protein